MTCLLHKPVVDPAINKMQQLRMIAEAFDDGGFTMIRIKELRLLLEAPQRMATLSTFLPHGEKHEIRQWLVDNDLIDQSV